MGRLFGIVFIVLAIWAGLEISSKGMNGAFGGLFGSGEPVAATATTPQRAGQSVQRAHEASAARRAKALGE